MKDKKITNDAKLYPLQEVWFCTFEKDGKVECIPAYFSDTEVFDLRDNSTLRPYEIDAFGSKVDENGNRIYETAPKISHRAFFRDLLKFRHVPNYTEISISSTFCAQELFPDKKFMAQEDLVELAKKSEKEFSRISVKKSKEDPYFVDIK